MSVALEEEDIYVGNKLMCLFDGLSNPSFTEENWTGKVLRIIRINSEGRVILGLGDQGAEYSFEELQGKKKNDLDEFRVLFVSLDKLSEEDLFHYKMSGDWSHLEHLVPPEAKHGKCPITLIPET